MGAARVAGRADIMDLNDQVREALLSMRACVIEQLTTEICRLKQSHPIRVAVDGRTASGKTTLADEIAAALSRHGRTVIRTSIDGFHNPRAIRYRQGRGSPQGYYQDARDLEAVRRLLLDPLGPGGDSLYRTASLDVERDEPVDQPAQQASADAVLIVDGTFLQRPELVGCWDYVIFVDVPEDVAVRRGAARDATSLGGGDVAFAAHAQRYQPAFAIYADQCDPVRTADAVVGNALPEAPDLQLRPRSI
jgi:uridine kinase